MNATPDENYYETRATDAIREDANQSAQAWALLGIREQLERIADHLRDAQCPTDSVDVMRSLANHFDNVGMGGASNEVRLLIRTAEKSRARYAD